MIVLALLGVASVGVGLAVYAVARRRGPRRAGSVAAVAAERVVAAGPTDAVDSDRITPETATGLGLVTAAVAVAVTGLLLGVLAFWIRHDAPFLSVDEVVERWAEVSATPASDSILRSLTHLGDTIVAVAVGLAVALWVAVRHRTLAPVAFVALVIAGQALIVNLIKIGVDRARPALAPRAGFSGQSFPSGHAATAAACSLAVALLLTVGREPRARAILIAGAVAVGVAVASSRVLLGVHWASDALAGLAVGWTWEIVCAVAFGGRLLRFGEPVAAVARRTDEPPERVVRQMERAEGGRR